MMSKYSALTQFLESTGNKEYNLSFDYIENVILGFKLPESAYKYKPWWANTPSGHSQSKAWLSIGWETSKVDLEEHRVTFLYSQTEKELVALDHSKAISIEEAKIGLAITFGIKPQNVEIIIKV